MHYAHMEFLSHEDIDRDVERIYRAYCDAMLLQYAKSPSSDYWAQVVEFRRANFGPLDRTEFVERAPKEVARTIEEQQELWAANKDKYVGRLEFLYWFDVRADFWSTVDKRTLHKEVVVPAEQLKLLHVQIEAVQRRLYEANADNWHCRHRNDEILESLSRPSPGMEAAWPSRE
jgi:hypothetical protein